jgi:hypothetical protein
MDTDLYTRSYLSVFNKFLDNNSALAQGFYAEKNNGWLRDDLWSQNLSQQSA